MKMSWNVKIFYVTITYTKKEGIVKKDIIKKDEAGRITERRLKRYSASGTAAFHMPGHKRQMECGLLRDFPNPFSIDITEIDGFDNLHHPEGILKDSMEWAAGVYGADHTLLSGKRKQLRNFKAPSVQ